MKRAQTDIKELDTTLHIWLDDPKDAAMPGHVAAIVAHMRSRGFTLELNQAVHPIIREGHYIGRKGALECTVERSGCSLKIEFFQNVVRENRNGGQYDFSKRKKMPFLIGKQYELEIDKLTGMMRNHGFLLQREVNYEGKDFIAHRRAELSAFHRGHYDKPPEAYNAQSADKEVLLTHGAKVYFKGFDKRWRIGQAFHNINNMWWVLSAGDEVSNHGSGELHLTPPADGLRGRHFNEGDQRKKQMDAQHRAIRAGKTKQVHVLRDILTPAFPYYVISLKHTAKNDRYITLWGQSGSGYRYAFASAGKYSQADVMAYLDHYNSGTNIAVDAETVERLSVLSDRECREMGPSRTAVLLNTPTTWYCLLANTIARPKYEPLPELLRQPEKKTRRRKEAA